MGFSESFFILTTFLKFSASVVVQTQHGPVEGIVRTSDLGREYFSFQGIPYARPAEGELKFKVGIAINAVILQFLKYS